MDKEEIKELLKRTAKAAEEVREEGTIYAHYNITEKEWDEEVMRCFATIYTINRVTDRIMELFPKLTQKDHIRIAAYTVAQQIVTCYNYGKKKIGNGE